MNPYAVEFDEPVFKQLQALPRKDFAAALRRIVALATEPRPHDVEKLTGTDSDHRIRIGSYRIVYEINDKTRTVTVGLVAHRSKVYR